MIAALASSRPARAAASAAFAAWSRARVAASARADVAAVQRDSLSRLVRAARDTRFGRDHGFRRVRSLDDFRRAVPLRTYEDLWADYLRPALPVLRDLTWPGLIPYLALTSGTTAGASKLIPVSRAMIASNFRASRTMLAHHVASRSRSSLLGGKMFFLGGSTRLEEVAPGVRQGDLSGIVALDLPSAARPFTFPTLDLALESDWDRKLTMMAERGACEPITLVGGVPSWLLALFDRVRSVAGKATVAEVWPHLELVVHGGVKFAPYRTAFAEALGSSAIALQDAYACSEGFLAHGDPTEEGLLRPVVDGDIFWELVPVEDLGSNRPARHWLGDFEVGVTYAVVVSTCAGLWGHVVGDTVRFLRRDPLLMTFAGRTKDSLSAFGEHLVGEEVEAAIAEAAEATGASVCDWHAGPVFEGPLGRHVFLVEFAREPRALGSFRDVLDASLSRRNDDYRAHRAEGVGLPAPDLVAVPRGGFEAWMRSRGKVGGQHKLPRMDDSGAMTAEIRAAVEGLTRSS